MTIPNNFYEIYQPKISTALKVLGRQKYMKCLREIRTKYNLEIGMDTYEEDTLTEFLETMRREYARTNKE